MAARVVGLDPGMGVLHADQPNRDSLAADLMEPIRPLVDRRDTTQDGNAAQCTVMARAAAPDLPASRRGTRCGAPTIGKRRTCSDACEADVQATQDRKPLETAGVRALAAPLAAGWSLLARARSRIGVAQWERQWQENAWNAATRSGRTQRSSGGRYYQGCRV